MFELFVVLALICLVGFGAVIGWERYRGRAGPGVRPTSEVFIDPESGQRTRVWYDPATGAREYRPE